MHIKYKYVYIYNTYYTYIYIYIYIEISKIMYVTGVIFDDEANNSARINKPKRMFIWVPFR